MRCCGSVLLLATCLAAQSESVRPVDPVAAYRRGSYQEAFATFQAECAKAGPLASSTQRWNLALAALRVQRSADAEAAVQPWLASDDVSERGDAEFVLGMAACQRAERAAAAAVLPDAEPLAWTMAVQAMERSLAAFTRASATRQHEWPEAIRNAARAEARLQALRSLRDAAAAPAARAESPPPPQPLPLPEPAPEPVPEEVPPALATDQLTATELAKVLQRVQQKEREKRGLRRAVQRRAGEAGERAW